MDVGKCLAIALLIACFANASGEDLESRSSIGNDTDTSGYAVVDTGQIVCYDDRDEAFTCPAEADAFYGQDAQHDGHQPGYTDNGDGTVTDNVTGLMWQQSPDTDGDGNIDATDKLSCDEAAGRADTLSLGGYTDWRMPTLLELSSLYEPKERNQQGYHVAGCMICTHG